MMMKKKKKKKKKKEAPKIPATIAIQAGSNSDFIRNKKS
jgi:hypothetical protein